MCLAFRNLNAILAEAGCSFSDLIDVTVFMVDPDKHFERAWDVAAEYWGEAPYPATTAVGISVRDQSYRQAARCREVINSVNVAKATGRRQLIISRSVHRNLRRNTCHSGGWRRLGHYRAHRRVGCDFEGSRILVTAVVQHAGVQKRGLIPGCRHLP